jgi:Ca2+-binding RTX toxin-like protein
LFGTDGTDKVNGGDGADLYDASAATSGVQINLDSIAHDLSPFAPGAGTVAANTATGIDIAGAFKDTVTRFEHVRGGSGADLIYGDAASNTLNAGADDDFLAGFGGNDTLKGGAGMDVLFGGAGRDRLLGGSDADFFWFTAVSDSGISSTTRDTILDFELGDRIDLSKIDANTKNGATDDAFVFIGTDKAFLGFAGQLRAYTTATGLIVEGDVNGDKTADFSIAIDDPQHALTLTSADFVL